MSGFEALQLQTKRLRLRPLQSTDATSVLAIRSDSAVMRYHTSSPWDSIEQANAMIDNDATSMRRGDYLRFGVERLEDDEIIGTCGLFSFDAQNKRAEIGYELHRDAWGHGYMVEALITLLNYGFAELTLNRIEADVHPDNIASIKLLQRLGFQKEGYLRESWIVGDELQDSIIFGLLRREWLPPQINP